MSETRIEKYKDYRASILTDDTPVIDNANNSPSHHSSVTTSTLPMDEVIQALDNGSKEEIFLRKNRRKKIISYSVIIGLVILVIVAFVVFGIILFK